MVLYSCQKKSESIPPKTSDNLDLSQISQKVYNALTSHSSVNVSRAPLDDPPETGPCSPPPCPDGWESYSFQVYETVSFYDALKCPTNILYCCDSIVVNYYFRYCINPQTNEIIINFTNFVATPLCDTVNQYWSKLFGEGLYDSLDLEIERFDYDVGELYETYVAQELMNGFGETFDCNTGVNYVQSNFITESCYKTCAKIVWDGGPKVDRTKVQCGYKCCKRHREYCLNSEDKAVEKIRVYTEINSCSNFGNLPPCTGGIYIGQCEKECGERP